MWFDQHSLRKMLLFLAHDVHYRLQHFIADSEKEAVLEIWLLNWFFLFKDIKQTNVRAMIDVLSHAVQSLAPGVKFFHLLQQTEWKHKYPLTFPDVSWLGGNFLKATNQTPSSKCIIHTIKVLDKQKAQNWRWSDEAVHRNSVVQLSFRTLSMFTVHQKLFPLLFVPDHFLNRWNLTPLTIMKWAVIIWKEK